MNQKEQKFVDTVWQYYRDNGRHTLPWRKTTDPYRIVVSEIMLQQTQVDRVLPKYQAFIKQWPMARALARASLGEVLIAWQGLGYNRRAKMLHTCAQVVIEEHKGKWPTSYEGLKSLPGIGPYTAGAVMAFSYDSSVPIIETNIRSVYIHHFFTTKLSVTEVELLTKITKTLPTENHREWYWALMDYGVYIKKTFGNKNKQAKQYKKQSKFAGSDRQIRGAVIRKLAHKTLTEPDLLKELVEYEKDRVHLQIMSLIQDGLVIQKANTYSLPS